MLDTLAEALKQMSVAEDGAEIASLCHSLLEWLLGTLREEPVKKEIVFLPYKASMWDSLESIWQAAAADAEHCNAYVIPIPYADLTPEHTAREWHVEKDLFPAYVPTIDFRSVDLEKMHPDVIFIHNPYDWANHVTSVDAHYYSEQLKKYTDKLVYVPYFNAGDSVTEGLCQAPGIVNADYVIVESYAIRNQYEHYYPGGNPPAGKFLSLGSPKYDKLQKGTKGDYPLPAHWKRLVEKKKIILYNTSLTEALQYSDKISAKLRYVFDFFRQRDDVVLWWRPHPLLKSTLDAMRPAYAHEYRQLEEQYQREGWGIYDDTPEVTRAVIWADAYYGDQSSVMYLYQVTEKPIMVQDFTGRMGRKWSPRYFSYLTFEGQTVWFVSKIFGAGMCLFEMDLVTDQVSALGMLPMETARFEGTARDAYCALIKIHEKIIIAPSLSGGDLIEYDCMSRQFTRVRSPLPLWTEEMQKRNKAAFRNVVRYKNSVFFIGNGFGLLVEYDGIRQQYFYHTEWMSGIIGHISSDRLVFERYGCFLQKNILYMVVNEEPFVICLNLDTLQARIHKIPFAVRLNYITGDGNTLWLLSSTDKVMIRWHEGENSFQKIFLTDGYGDFPFCGCIPLRGAIEVFPWNDERIAEIRGDGTVHWKTSQDLLDRRGKNIGRISGNLAAFFPKQRRGFVLMFDGNTLMEMDTSTGEVSFHRQKVLPFSVDKKTMQFWREGEILSLSDFLTLHRSGRIGTCSSETAGAKIYQKIVCEM